MGQKLTKKIKNKKQETPFHGIFWQNKGKGGRIHGA